VERRTIDELLRSDLPAWPEVQALIGAAGNTVEAIAPGDDAAETLVTLQVTAKSTLGAITYHTGGLLVDHGWVRVLGSSSGRVGRSITGWNAACGAWPTIEALLVADDVLGGQFAVNGGQFDGPKGNVFYFAPNSLTWDDLDRGYSDFFAFLMNGDLNQFYTNLRWPGWERESCDLAGDRGFSVYPPLWMNGPPIGDRSRRVISLHELVMLRHDIVTQLNVATGKPRSR
jgi:hypothetical protein